MKIAKINYKGNLRTTATHLASAVSIVTDAPLDNNGKGESFSPTDLLSTALASCMLTIMGIAANTHAILLSDVEIDVYKVMGQNPRRVIEIGVEMYIKDNNFTEKDKKILLESAKNCPVAKSLHPDINQRLVMNFITA